MKDHKFNIHGGNIYQASKEYSINVEEIIDFSANINPLGIPAELKELIFSTVNNLEHYPDPGCTELRMDISRYLNVPQESVIVGNGASEIIYLLFETQKPKKVLIPAPSFAEYPKAAERYGTKVGYFRLNEDEDFRIDMKALTVSVDRDTEAVVLCNPNNPTSKMIEKESLVELLEFTSQRNISVIVDETFIELTPGSNLNSIVGLTARYSKLFVIRAFTKLFAIPGLRLGYGIGETGLVRKMWEIKMPWSVNSFACSAGKIFLEGKEYLLQTTEWLAAEKTWFFQQLSAYKAFKVFEPETNFILVKILDERWDARTLKEKMMARGILIRDASNFMFLNHKFFRIAIKDRQKNIAFLNALQDTITP